MLAKAVARIMASFRMSQERKAHFFDQGFHGDRHLLKLVDHILQDCDYLVETGTDVGTTLAYVARTYPHIECMSCELDRVAFKQALKNTALLSNAKAYNKSSQEFLPLIVEHRKELLQGKVLFWLDAHGYGFQWPLKEEVEFITTHFKQGFILIDDFKVPDMECFRWDAYDDQICSFDLIKDSIAGGVHYSLYYPSYTERTSSYHPLVGWGLLVFGGIKELEPPQELKDKIRKAL